MKKNFILIISVLIFLGIVFLLDLPAYNKFAFLSGEVEKYSKLLEEREEFIVKVAQLKDVYESRKSEIKKAYYSLPFEKDIPNLIVQFEALASENGLILENLNFFEEKPKKTSAVEWTEGGAEPLPEIEPRKTYKVLKVVLGATGSYQSLRGFLGALEYNVRLMDVKIIEFSSEEKEFEQGLFTFDIQLEVYYQ